MDLIELKNEFKRRIDAIARESFNNEQKEIAKQIIDTADANSIESVYQFVTQRVKTGFVFDVAPEVNHNCISLAIEDKSLFVDSISNPLIFDEHTLIIGENYDALKNLMVAYTNPQNGKGMINLIYIDPPYNTEKAKDDGNDYKIEVQASKFVYRDKFTRDGWLNMMNERLKLSRKLLTDNGVIFISIDDNEYAYLKVLADEIFGESNFIATIVHKNNSNKNQSKFIGVSTEYMLVYAKSLEILKQSVIDGWRIPKDGAGDIHQLFRKLKSQNTPLDKILDEVKDMYRRPKYAHLSRWNKIDNNGIFKDSDLSRAKGSKDYTIINPNTGKPCAIPGRGWGKSYEELVRLQKADLIWYGDDSTPPGMKSYISDDSLSVPDNFWFFDNSIDTKLLIKLFGFEVFDNPKSVNMMKRIITMVLPEKDGIVLDFFAGSGTTGQAVMEVNNDDGGKRKFILITNNENDIAEKITRERLYRVINGVGSKGETIEWEYPAQKNAKSLIENKVRVFRIENYELKLGDIDKARSLIPIAEEQFKLLNPSFKPRSTYDLYNELSSLNPYKGQ